MDTNDNSLTEDAPVTPYTMPDPRPEAERGWVSPLTLAHQTRRPTGPQPGKDPEFSHVIPPDHHMEALPDDGTAATAYGRGALDELWQVHEKIIATALKVENKAALAKEVAPAVQRAADKMREKLRHINTRIEQSHEEIGKEVGSGLGPLMQEIRAHVKSLPASERVSFVTTAIRNYDTTTAKAIIAVPAYLSGLEPEHYAPLKEMGEELIASKPFQERAAARRAHAKASRALEHFEQTMNRNLTRWKSGDEAKIADLMNSLAPKPKE